MIIDQPGKVTERITLLGTKESCVYLLDGGESYTLLGGGFTSIAPAVEGQLKDLEIEPERIHQLVILHSHFDHCGIVPYFKKKWPWIRVVASERAKKLLSTPKVAAGIGALNRQRLKEVLPDVSAGDLCLDGFNIGVDRVVADGDILTCGRLDLQVLETPGHSTCSLSLYFPLEKALFASDAAGIPTGEMVFTAANSSFDDYLRSLERMFALEPEILLAEHQGCRTGEDCRKFMALSRESALQTRDLVESTYARTGDIEKSTEEITDKFMTMVPGGWMSAWVMKLVVGSMVYQVSRRRSKV
ncbi:MAG: MBL fold metallo-hydrolase [Deltaproteobacteria bacterium]|jgi:glyoxylase-like metal-dependent hydrolase (beta-lactamase superfamily II)|nr:MBL fold metallo-hydrolase [Deltaproteobacteria bacterium]